MYKLGKDCGTLRKISNKNVTLENIEAKKQYNPVCNWIWGGGHLFLSCSTQKYFVSHKYLNRVLSFELRLTVSNLMTLTLRRWTSPPSLFRSEWEWPGLLFRGHVSYRVQLNSDLKNTQHANKNLFSVFVTPVWVQVLKKHLSIGAKM